VCDLDIGIDHVCNFGWKFGHQGIQLADAVTKFKTVATLIKTGARLELNP
jgi:hypothetical protein